MTPQRALRAYAPASIGNFGAGFDLLGAALAPLDGSPLGDWVHLEAAAEDGFKLSGPGAKALKKERRPNLALRTRDLFRARLQAKGMATPPMALHLEKHLPLSSGLGSSASSIVATLVALQAFHGEPLSRVELLEVAAEAEGTYSGTPIYDNVAASLHGGLQLTVPGEQGPTVRALPWPEDLLLLVVHPQFELPTAQSRAVLPQVLGIASAVEFAGNLAGFIHALHSHDRRLLTRCLHDELAEPHRENLVPGFISARERALAEGALTCGLSGSGPALFAVLESESRAETVRAGILASFSKAGLEAQAWLCGLDLEGARILP